MKLKSQVTELPEQYLRCHAFGHWWDFKTDFDVTVGRGGTLVEYRTLLICARCTTEVRITRDKYRDVLRRAYAHPPGYGMAPDGDGPQLHHRRRAFDEELRRMNLIAA